mgnify:CR=1 FL=1
MTCDLPPAEVLALDFYDAPEQTRWRSDLKTDAKGQAPPVPLPESELGRRIAAEPLTS